MFINISASETGNNKGSSSALVNYLEKENHLQVEQGKGLGQENWFNGSRSNIIRQEVRMKIDRNIAKLGRNDAKFFLINISPSQKELAYLYGKYGKEGAKEKLKEFAVKMMDEYAKNFKRPGINSNKDLLWYGKHENYRYYSHTDKEVKDGTRQRGERKEGQQDHLQLIVSRKDITNSIKLSPQNTSKGKNKEHSEKLGQFNRTAFKQSGESLFDKMFEFDRGLKDTMAYANIHKNGNAQQRQQLNLIEQGLKTNPTMEALAAGLIKEVADGVFQSGIDLGKSTASALGGLLELLMEPVYNAPTASVPAEQNPKKKKKRYQSQGYGRGM